MSALSVVIPTRDRPELLRDTLAGLAEQDAPAGTFDVLVVDDGSRAPLDPLVREHSGKVAMRCERQEPSGLNVARNLGARASQGELIAYLDDDVLLPPGWARALIAGFEALGCDGLAGRIRLNLPGDAPRWLSPRLRRYLSELELGPEPRLLDGDLTPYGANCAVTRDAFTRAGGFVPELDRTGASLRSNGDVEFFRRLRAHGGRIGWWPDAEVEHRVPAERLTLEWFRQRAYNQGYSDELLLPPPPSRLVRGRRLAREVVRLGRSVPILARGVLTGRGVHGAGIWASYCRGRMATLRATSR
jgi:glycosyltransferase involved in cell wall biosynthesis